MNALVLSREEIRVLTGVWQHAAQARALSRLKIPFQRRTIDGSCIVGREAASRAMHWQAEPDSEAANDHSHDEPVWSVKT